MSVVWASRILGRPLPERVAGIDLMMRMLELAAKSMHRVYCLGATPEVLDAAVNRIGELYPDVMIAGRHHGHVRYRARVMNLDL